MCDESSRPQKSQQSQQKPITSWCFWFFGQSQRGAVSEDPAHFIYVCDRCLLIISFPVRTGIIPNFFPLFFQKQYIANGNMHNRSKTPWLDWLVPPPRSCIGHYLASVQTMLYTVIQHVCFFLCLPFFMQARPSIAVSPGVAHTARYRIRYCDRKLDARLYPNRRSRSWNLLGGLLSWTGMSKKLQNAFLFSKNSNLPNNSNSDLSNSNLQSKNCKV